MAITATIIEHADANGFAYNLVANYDSHKAARYSCNRGHLHHGVSFTLERTSNKTSETIESGPFTSLARGIQVFNNTVHADANQRKRNEPVWDAFHSGFVVCDHEKQGTPHFYAAKHLADTIPTAPQA